MHILVQGPPHNEPRIVDQASSETEAEALVKRYQTGYGPAYTVWWEYLDTEGAE